jgi:hypothetical protein
MINEKTTTHTPHHISGTAELRVIVRWLRSIDSRMISRLRSAVILLFSSIVVFVLRVLDYFFDHSRPVVLSAARSDSASHYRFALQR